MVQFKPGFYLRIMKRSSPLPPSPLPPQPLTHFWSILVETFSEKPPQRAIFLSRCPPPIFYTFIIVTYLKLALYYLILLLFKQIIIIVII